MWYFHQKLSDSQKNPKQTQTLPLPKPQQNAKIPLLEQSWMCLWNVCQQEVVGRATYRLCTCRYFASGILMGSAQAGICQHEIFFTISAVWPTFGNSCSFVKENLVSFWMTLELALRCPALKEWAPVPAECCHFEGMGLASSFNICLNRQTLDLQVKVKWVYAHKKIKKADTQNLHSF